MSLIETLEDLDKLRDHIIAQRNAKETWLAVCSGTGCRAAGPRSAGRFG